MSAPLISVIIPVFNGEKFLQDAINSVIDQRYPNIEILVIDNASADKSAEIAKSNTEVSYFLQTIKGPSATKNLGIAMAKGSYLTFLDCDDLYSKNSLTVLSSFMEQNPSCDIAQGLVSEMNRLNASSPFKKSSEPYYFSLPGSCLFRSSVFQEVGHFDEKLIYSENVDWYMRAWELNVEKREIPINTLFYRKHEMNMTKDTSERNHYRLLMFKNRLARQRNNPNRPKPVGELTDYICDISFGN